MKKFIFALCVVLHTNFVISSDFENKINKESTWINIIVPEQSISTKYCCWDGSNMIIANFNTNVPVKCDVSYILQIIFEHLKRESNLKKDKHVIKLKRSGSDFFDPNEILEFNENNNVLYAYVYSIKK